MTPQPDVKPQRSVRRQPPRRHFTIKKQTTFPTHNFLNEAFPVTPQSTAMPSVLKTLMAKLKRKRRSRLSKSERSHSGVEVMSTAELGDLALSPPTTTQMAEDSPKPHVFGEETLKFNFDVSAFTNTILWPGPSYNEYALFAPGSFHKPRHLKRNSKRKIPDRTLSNDERYIGAPKPLVRADQKHNMPAPRKQSQVRRTPPPQYYGTPPARDPPLHLLSLPGEIRNQIHRILCAREGPIIAQFRPIMKPKRGRGERGVTMQRFPREPVLALVCKQLQREAMSIFYAENVFVFRKKNYPATSLCQPPIMTWPANMELWKPKFGFEDSLTEIRVEFKVRDPTWNALTLVYEFSKLPSEETYTIADNLDDLDEWCTCAEREAKAWAETHLNAQQTITKCGVLKAASEFVALRKLHYASEGVVHSDLPLYRLSKAVCEDCQRQKMADMESGL